MPPTRQQTSVDTQGLVRHVAVCAIIFAYMRDELTKVLVSEGAGLVGFADLRGIPSDVRQSFPFAVSIAVPLDPRIVFGIRNGPTVDYWEEYKRVNAVLMQLAGLATEFLLEAGHAAKPLAPTIMNYDPTVNSRVSYVPETMSTALPHKTAATLSGLGWIGKCALLVTREFGSALRLTTVLTDANDLHLGKPVDKSRCGNCTRCVDTCPGHAPSGRIWEAGMERQDFFDAFACRDAALDQAAAIGVHDTICGRCIAACRRTRRYLRRAGLPVRDMP
jgi:epoxyqueuosine reductase